MRLLISNRGEIARRILRAGRTRGYRVAVVSTTADRDSLVRREADDVLEVSSFLDGDAIASAARAWGAKLLHPGYGFLSEDPEFARRVEDAGIRFVGPTPENMRALGEKESAKALATACGVPVLEALPSAELAELPSKALESALHARGFAPPYLVKATGGGGGRGMRLVATAAELDGAIRRASDEAREAFGDPRVFVERYVEPARHVEIQVFGDGKGGGVFLGERECSLQRRHQKLVEESPSVAVDRELREALGRASLALVRETLYRGAGTVEFLLDTNRRFYFIEVNTRLQVEHPVTEMVYGVDLVDAQFDLAEGRWPARLPNPRRFEVLEPDGAAIEARVLAEDPRQGFVPTPGRLVLYREPPSEDAEGVEGVRVDSGVTEGDRVNAAFDSLIAKVIVHGSTRAEATQRLDAALEATTIHGATTNLPFLVALVRHPDFRAGAVSTRWVDEHVAELNQPLLPPPVMTALSTPGFREKLSLAVAGGRRRVSPWAERFGAQSGESFRVGSPLERPSLHVSKGGKPAEVLLSGPGVTAMLEEAVLDDARYSENLRRLAAPKVDRTLSALVSRVSVSELALSLFGETLRLPCPRHRVRDANQTSSDREILSPMAGKVLEVRIREGQDVEAGQVAFVVESMKMQLEVRAKSDGRVQKIHVTAGQQLAGPDTMATLA